MSLDEDCLMTGIWAGLFRRVLNGLLLFSRYAITAWSSLPALYGSRYNAKVAYSHVTHTDTS